jgi:hypothetical protein
MSAIPVDGECELVNSKMSQPADNAVAYICGEIVTGNETVGVLDLEALVRCHSESTVLASEARL